MRRDPLTQPGQSGTAGRQVGRTRTVATGVDHLHPQSRGIVGHDHVGASGARVLDHVGEPLLDDPVGAPADLGGQLGGFSSGAQGDVEAGAGQPLDQPGQVRQAGRRGRRLLGPQQAEHPVQVVQGPPAGRLDGQQRVTRALRVAVEHRSGRTGLQHHQAHAVSHNVVQLAGDACPLGHQRSGPVTLLARSQLSMRCRQGRLPLPVVANQPAECPGADEYRQVADQVGGGTCRRLGDRVDRQSGQHHDERGDALPGRPVGAAGVDHDEQGEETRHHRCRPQHLLHDESAAAGGRGQDHGPAAQGNRPGHDEEGEQLTPPGTLDLLAPDDQLADGRRGQCGREHGIPPHRSSVAREPTAHV